MRTILTSLPLLASALLGPSAAQVVFEPPRITPGPGPAVFLTDPVLGDLDQDGDLDAIVTSGAGVGGTVSTFVNDGSGTFTAGPAQVGVGGPRAAALADMNGDTLPDYVLAFSGFVIVYWGDGEGGFDGNTSFNPTFGGASELALGDVNDDAIPDIVLTTPGAPIFQIPSVLQVWTGDGSGFTLGHSQALPGYPTDFDLADLDGDARLDAIVTRNGIVSWHEGLAAGAFGEPTVVAGTIVTTRIVAGDLDGDGDADLALGSTAPQIQPLFNDGAGGLAPGGILPAGAAGATPAIGDVDADGVADLVLDDSGDGAVGEVVVFRGLGGGAFEEDVHVTAGGLQASGALVLGDLDGDARVDVLTGNVGVASYLNRTYGPGSPFFDLGFALPGSNGYPVQVASGTLAVGTPFAFKLMNGLPGGPATLVAGINAAYLPHKGGVMVPSPDLLLPGFPINAQGAVTLAGNWPPGLPSGVTLYLQWWFKDATGPTPKAATSGLSLTTP